MRPTAHSSTPTAGIFRRLWCAAGGVQRLDVNGTVVGAFPFAEYGESRIGLELGDLLVFFTDGVTEPENEYGEMFGEERFLDLLVRNAHLGEEEIVRTVIESVRAVDRLGRAAGRYDAVARPPHLNSANLDFMKRR